MAFTPIGPPHVVGGVIHVQILHDMAIADPNAAFQARINAPGYATTMQIGNDVTQEYPIPIQLAPTLQVKVENFHLLPAGATPANATALSFLLVFRIKEIFMVTIGSVPVTANLKAPPQ